MATLKIPDELHARVRALGVDVSEYCRAAIEAALRRAPVQESTIGRPFKRAGRKQVTVQLEPDYLQQVDALAAALKVSRPDALNLILEAAISDGILTKLTKKTT